MEKNNGARHGQLEAVGISRRKFLGSLFTSVTSIGFLGGRAEGRPLAGVKGQSKLQPGDIVFVDSGSGIEGGFVIRVNSETGEKGILSSGGLLQNPFGVAFEASGQVIVSDSSRLIGINPETGAQSLLADNSRGDLGQPYGLAVERPGLLAIANLKDVLRLDVSSNRIQTISTGGTLQYPLGVAMGSRNEFFVLNMAFPPEIIRVSPKGGQMVISRGGLLKAPQAIAVLDPFIYVTDVATPDGNFGIGRIIAISMQSGEQTVVAEGEYLSGPVGIAATERGELIVGDPYTTTESSQQFQGGIMRVDPVTSKQTLITQGEGDFVNPRGVAIVPS